MRPTVTLSFVLTLILAMGASRPACADVVRLKSGGEIRGEILDPEEGAASDYIIKLPSGGQLTVARADVEQIVVETDLEREYDRRARDTPDSLDAHWELAKWCRENRLRDESNAHLERILELEPNHTDARSLLGYRSENGQWITRDQLMASRGMVMYRGKYRTAQEIGLLGKKNEHDENAGDWRSQLRRWYRRLSDRQPERVREARDKFLAIRDPKAAVPLANMLRREEKFEAKLLFLEVLSQLDHLAAFDALVWHNLYDPMEEIRAQSLDYLIDSKQPSIAGPFMRALSSKDNFVVNRAAQALQEIGDASAVRPLIAALVTEHKVVIGSASGGDQYAVSPSSGVSSFGGGGPRVEKYQRTNPAVLSALVALSGGPSFGYDEQRWRAWLAAQTTNQQVDLRRDN